jgi:hypothetical protein
MNNASGENCNLLELNLAEKEKRWKRTSSKGRCREKKKKRREEERAEGGMEMERVARMGA